MLQLDITNAFNSCDRTRLLSELYGLSGLQSVYRMADFAYDSDRCFELEVCPARGPSSASV